MAAALWREQNHVRVRRDRWMTQRVEWDKRVVLRVYDERRDTYVLNQRKRAGLCIVIICIFETSVRRRVAVIEIAYRPHRMKIGYVIQLREKFLLLPDAASHAADKALEVETIVTPLDGVGARVQIHRGRDGADARDFSGHTLAVFTS